MPVFRSPLFLSCQSSLARAKRGGERTKRETLVSPLPRRDVPDYYCYARKKFRLFFFSICRHFVLFSPFYWRWIPDPERHKRRMDLGSNLHGDILRWECLRLTRWKEKLRITSRVRQTFTVHSMKHFSEVITQPFLRERKKFI